MEAYFHSDPRLQEWINQITEKIFAVCLLTEVDSAEEFHRGSEIVTEVANLLQGISMFPSEYLEDGLRQLLEQQLPDSRVISNFPTFYETMNLMIRAGIIKETDNQINQNKDSLKALSSFDQNTQEDIKEGLEDVDDPKEKTGSSVNTPSDELASEIVIAALASVKTLTPPIIPIPIPTKPYGIVRKTQVPEQAGRLHHVLNIIFPNASICWNLHLMGQTFLAEVEDILICLQNLEQPCPVENLNKEGWKVYVCSLDDLMFPRRLERGIRHVQRFGKQLKKE